MFKLTLLSITATTLVCIVAASMGAEAVEPAFEFLTKMSKPSDSVELANLRNIYSRFSDFCLQARDLVYLDMSKNMTVIGIMNSCKRNEDNLEQIRRLFADVKAKEGAKFEELAKADLKDVDCVTLNRVLNFSKLCGYFKPN